MQSPLVIKLSGKALESEDKLRKFLSCIDCRKPTILVHGGGVEVDSLLNKLGLETTKIEGIRVTSQKELPYVLGALAGTCNKKLQAMMQEQQKTAIGLLCTDGNTLKVTRLPSRYGFVGTTEACDKAFLQLLFTYNITPVISSIGIDENGNLLNINADDVALSLAVLFKSPLLFVSDVPGVYDAKGEIIRTLNEDGFNDLKDKKVIKDGMLVKVKAALNASKQTSKEVVIFSINDTSSFSNLYSLRHLGTTINAN